MTDDAITRATDALWRLLPGGVQDGYGRDVARRWATAVVEAADMVRPWCGAPAEYGGQQPCPMLNPCDAATCRLGAAAGRELYAPAAPGLVCPNPDQAEHPARSRPNMCPMCAMGTVYLHPPTDQRDALVGADYVHTVTGEVVPAADFNPLERDEGMYQRRAVPATATPDDPPRIHRDELIAALDRLAITDPDRITALHLRRDHVLIVRAKPGPGKRDITVTTNRIEIR